LAARDEPSPGPGWEPLLEQVVRDGQALELPPLEELRARHRDEMRALPPALLDVTRTASYPVRVSPVLAARQRIAIEGARRREGLALAEPPLRGVTFGPHDALVVCDVQNDFLPGGALPVSRGDEIIDVLSGWVERALVEEIPVFATRDWHPPHHASFYERGGPWPPHCIQGSWGAEIAKALRLPATTIIVSKGHDPNRDAYSAFDGTELDRELLLRRIRRIFICGLATEYCVLFTARDALSKGYQVVLLHDAVRPIDAHPGDGARAEAEMIRRGATPTSLAVMAP
jgi:nicotinamidase/pyrazinamidase